MAAVVVTASLDPRAITQVTATRANEQHAPPPHARAIDLLSWSGRRVIPWVGDFEVRQGQPSLDPAAAAIIVAAAAPAELSRTEERVGNSRPGGL